MRRNRITAKTFLRQFDEVVVENLKLQQEEFCDHLNVNTMIDFIAHRKIFYIISIILAVVSLASLLLWGLKLAIDFTGGSLLEVEFQESIPSSEQIKESLANIDLGEINTQLIGQTGAILKFKHIDENVHSLIIERLKQIEGVRGLNEKRFESIGPMIGGELKGKAVWAVVLVLLMIILYIAWVFRQVSKPVSSFYYGIAAIVALFHDVIIPLGVFAMLGHFYNMEINLLFITGLLTILGFSVHDTIVVFDRIRENLRKGYFKDFETTVSESIKQTLGRSVSTSLTVLFTVLAIYIFGGETIKNFSLLLIVGLFFGTYSSIFIASPFLVSLSYLQKRLQRK